MIVVAIIGILATIAPLAYSSYQAKAKVAAGLADIASLKAAFGLVINEGRSPNPPTHKALIKIQPTAPLLSTRLASIAHYTIHQRRLLATLSRYHVMYQQEVGRALQQLIMLNHRYLPRIIIPITS